MIAGRIAQITARIAGSGALILGLLYWLANIDLIDFHMLFGLVVSIMLIVASILALITKGMRVWGIVGIAYAVFLPIFGVMHASILVGDLHWLIQIAHVLVGVGAVVLTGSLVAHCMALKNNTSVKPTAVA